jgi:hypothetical protein
VSAIRAFFRRNRTPIYFVSPTAFNLLGVDRWISGFHYVNYSTRLAAPSRVFVPERRPHAEFTSMEDVNNYLLAHPEFQYLVERNGGGKAVLVMFDETTEHLATQLGIGIALPSAQLRHRIDSKLVTTRLGNEAGVPSAPNVLVPPRSSRLCCAGSPPAAIVLRMALACSRALPSPRSG